MAPYVCVISGTAGSRFGDGRSSEPAYSLVCIPGIASAL